MSENQTTAQLGELDPNKMAEEVATAMGLDRIACGQLATALARGIIAGLGLASARGARDAGDSRSELERVQKQLDRAKRALERSGFQDLGAEEWKPPLNEVAGKLLRQVYKLEQQLVDMERRKDGAYEERNRVVAALAKCFPSGVARTAIEGWSEDWHGCVYIDLPTGQASWHFHDSQAFLFADLPPYLGAWDGHTTDEKYNRIAQLELQGRECTSEAEHAHQNLIERSGLADPELMTERIEAYVAMEDALTSGTGILKVSTEGIERVDPATIYDQDANPAGSEESAPIEPAGTDVIEEITYDGPERRAEQIPGAMWPDPKNANFTMERDHDPLNSGNRSAPLRRRHGD